MLRLTSVHVHWHERVRQKSRWLGHIREHNETTLYEKSKLNVLIPTMVVNGSQVPGRFIFIMSISQISFTDYDFQFLTY